jgi:hypothetical protein
MRLEAFRGRDFTGRAAEGVPFLACGERRPDGILRKGYAKPGTDRDHSRCAFMEKDAANGGAGNCPACFVSAGDAACFANSRPMPLPRPPEASLLHSTFPLPIKILPSAKHRSRFIGNRFYRSGKPFLILRGICSPVLLKNDSVLILSLINGK